MIYRYIFILTVLAVALGFSGKAQAETAISNYALIDTAHFPGSVRWDYLTFDTQNHHLFITRGDSVDVWDTDGEKIVATIPNLEGTHGVAIADDLNKGFITEGKANRVTVFDLTTLKTTLTVPTETKPDAIVYDPATGRVFAANGESGSLTAINAKDGAVIATIKLDGKPEFAVVDGKGRLYVNLEDKAKLAVVDTKKLSVKTRYDLAATCEEPTGLAIDAAKRRLFSVCGNKVMVITDGKTGKVIDTLPIGAHSDAAIFDSGTGLAFSSNGDGTLTVAAPNDPDHYQVVQTVETKPTARTMALDPATHRIYLVAAEPEDTDPPTAEHPDPRPHMKPDSFMLLTVGQK